MQPDRPVLERRRRAVLPALFAGALLALTAPVAAQDIELSTFSGSYLAGRAADTAHDLAAAARFYASALREDPGNPLLQERVVMLNLAVGNIDEAVGYADDLIATAPGNPIAHITIAVDALAAGGYRASQASLADVAPAPLASLTAGLLTAWAQQGTGELDAALATVDALSGPTWYEVFKTYHKALLLDAAGRSGDAAAFIEQAYGADNAALRIVDAYARIMARAGRREEAVAAVMDFAGEQPLHPSARVLLDELRAGLTPAPIADDTGSGAAEVLYGLGSAIGGDDGPELPAAYLRLAVHLDPDAPLAVMSIGDVLQEADRCEEAIAVYDTIPTTEPLRRNADLQIGNCLHTLSRLDEAADRVRPVLDADPADFEAAIQLGNIYRADEEYALAADAYSRGIERLPRDAGGIWRIYYFRGIAYERSKQWPLAEPDFLRALELNPDQPQVLNYLGYSWVDMGLNLEPALEMIRTAVDLRPEDGYIVDSLGWAYYRLDRFEDAVVELERAVELRPEDPIINDHLGDAYWKVGRKREAVFQWTHARDLEPEEELLPVILAKLDGGLEAAADIDTAIEAEPAAEPVPETIEVAAGDSLWTIAERLFGDGSLFGRLFENNADTIENADLIFPGMTLRVPALDTD